MDPRRTPSLCHLGRPLRIAYGRFFHEANTYSPQVTDRAAFDNAFFLEGDALARATGLLGAELPGYMPHAELTGFVQAARLAGDVETVPLASYLAVPSGPLERSAFEDILEDLLERLAHAGTLDAVYLALHGSMEVVGLGEAPEAVILRRVREVLGPRPRLAATFDLHANLSQSIVDALDVLYAYRTNPHWDLCPTGFRAGRQLIDALRGRVTPTHAFRKLPMVLGGGNTINFLTPMRDVFRAMRRMERDPRVLSASLCMVHPYTGAEDLGWSVYVATDGNPALAQRLVEELADLAWAKRTVEMPTMYSVEDAIATARELRRSLTGRLGPVTLVDVDDIVSAGAPGGNTNLVRALAEHGSDLRAYVPVHDPLLVAATWDHAIGSTHDLVLRGTPGYGMPELPLRATVAARATSEFGRKVRLDIELPCGSTGALHCVITEGPPLPLHPRFWRELGLDPRRADVLVQKSFFHYRIFYAALSFAHVPVTSNGATSFRRVRERSYRTPTHPATRLDDWRPLDWNGHSSRRDVDAQYALGRSAVSRGA